MYPNSSKIKQIDVSIVAHVFITNKMLESVCGHCTSEKRFFSELTLNSKHALKRKHLKALYTVNTV